MKTIGTILKWTFGIYILCMIAYNLGYKKSTDKDYELPDHSHESTPYVQDTVRYTKPIYPKKKPETGIQIDH